LYEEEGKLKPLVFLDEDVVASFIASKENFNKFVIYYVYNFIL